MDFSKFANSIEKAKDADQLQTVFDAAKKAATADLEILERRQKSLQILIGKINSDLKDLSDLAALKSHSLEPFPTAEDEPRC